MDYIELGKQAILLIISFVMLIKGADWFVEGASKLADKLGISQLVIGLTIVAMGTSAPEAAVSITSALKGNSGIAIGNILGSNILNILLILGITSVIIPVAVAKSTLFYEIPFMIITSVAVLLLGMKNSDVSRLDGVFILVIFLLFIVSLIYMERKRNLKLTKELIVDESQVVTQEKKATQKSNNLFKVVILFLLGGGFIVWGSSITVNSASAIAVTFNISPRLIGLTIVAFGTSLPELITSVMAAIKGKSDIAIGNIVGSNIFNILFIVGVAALINPIEFEPSFIFDGIISIVAAIVLFLCVLKSKKLTKASGVIMLLLYFGYFIYIQIA